jgi:hypothetical protein
VARAAEGAADDDAEGDADDDAEDDAGDDADDAGRADAIPGCEAGPAPTVSPAGEAEPPQPAMARSAATARTETRETLTASSWHETPPHA